MQTYFWFLSQGEDIVRKAELLSSEEVIQVHEASLEILENVGMLVRNEKAREIFAAHGCMVDTESFITRIPRSIVEEYRKLFVSTFTFTGRDPSFDRTLPRDSPVIVTGSSAPNIIDPETGKERRATSSDIANIAFTSMSFPDMMCFPSQLLLMMHQKTSSVSPVSTLPSKTASNLFEAIRRT